MASNMIIAYYYYNNYSNYLSALFFYPIFASFVYNHSFLLLKACGEEILLHAFLHHAVLEIKSNPPTIHFFYNNNNNQLL